MPLVLTQNEKSAASVTYDDRLGATYEFPKRYLKVVVAGKRFIYYQGKRGTRGTQVPHYFGTGVVGEVSEASNGRFRCAIHDYHAFDSVVQFKKDDRYLEPAANGRTSKEVGLHFRTGVREIGQDAFDTICAVGLGRPATKKGVSTKASKAIKANPSSTPKVTKDADKALYELAIALAIAEAKKQWPDGTLFRAAASQQFSLAIRLPRGATKHVAVRATTESKPLVRLTVSDISFSNTHSSTYSLWVFYGVDVERGTAYFLNSDGAITDADIDLRAAVHGGRLKNAKAGRKVGPILG